MLALWQLPWIIFHPHQENSSEEKVEADDDDDDDGGEKTQVKQFSKRIK